MSDGDLPGDSANIAESSKSDPVRKSRKRGRTKAPDPQAEESGPGRTKGSPIPGKVTAKKLGLTPPAIPALEVLKNSGALDVSKLDSAVAGWVRGSRVLDGILAQQKKLLGPFVSGDMTSALGGSKSAMDSFAAASGWAAQFAKMRVDITKTAAWSDHAVLSADLLRRLQIDLGPTVGGVDEATVRALEPLYRVTQSRAMDFQDVEDEPSPYSPELSGPESYFRADEGEIDSFQGLTAAITRLIDKNPDLELVWRGHQNAGWGLHSNLYRRLMARNGVAAPSANPVGNQNFPNEDEMNTAEAEILRVARDEWRMDGIPALEIFARLQHHGAPTRLIDVTRNPYIGAWFAVESDPELDNLDGRLIAIATTPVRRPNDSSPTPDPKLRLDELGSAYTPFWHEFATSEHRQGADWGTGAQRRLWVPPPYDERIVAQNAGFLLDGVPMMTPRIARNFRIPNTTRHWTRADLLASASIFLKTAKPTRKAPHNASRLAPSFTFRISANGKREIREFLEKRMSLNHSTMYRDISGLARWINKTPGLDLHR